MSRNTNHQLSAKVTFVGIVIGATLAILFAKMGSPGLIGVGAVIGMSIASALGRRVDQ